MTAPPAARQGGAEEGPVLVVGLGVAGEAAARRLAQRGAEVVVMDDHPGKDARRRAGALAAHGVKVVEAPGASHVEALVDASWLIVPSPGVPASHPATRRALAAGITVWSEFELAARWSSTPFVAVTGTNGKTTVVTLIEQMLHRSGLRTVAAGNTDLPLVDALDRDLDVIVVEASSFRLHFTETFRPSVAVWLNVGTDHLDWHGTFDDYARAKARIWANQGPDDVAVANIDDPIVMGHTTDLKSRLETFGASMGDWHVEEGRLVGPAVDLVAADELKRSLPHDLTNVLAAAAASVAAGATVESVRDVARSFEGLPHRMQLVGEHDGVRYVDDSKATDPHATVTALRAYERVVLIAGGRNKGADLGEVASAAGNVRAVVAIGEAAGEVRAAFEAVDIPVSEAQSMGDAVLAAANAAEPGDVVLLSPACASYDWYRSYADRGDDFGRAVSEHVGGSS